jgi:hypothetical protein
VSKTIRAELAEHKVFYSMSIVVYRETLTISTGFWKLNREFGKNLNAFF